MTGSSRFQPSEYIPTELPIIAKFVTHIVSKLARIPPVPICSCYDIFKIPGAVDAIMSEGKAFLKRLEPLRTSLNLFSDENNVAIATRVESTLSMLRKEGLSNPPLAADLQHHKSRLNKNHATSFWKDVRWLSPTFIISTARTQNYAPITCARANDLLKNNVLMFHCTEAAWETYVTHGNYKWSGGACTDIEWWEKVRRYDFPEIKAFFLKFLCSSKICSFSQICLFFRFLHFVSVLCRESDPVLCRTKDLSPIDLVVLDFPPKSPDLNPIENNWEIMDAFIKNGTNPENTCIGSKNGGMPNISKIGQNTRPVVGG